MCLQYETEDLCPAVKVADNPLSITSLAIGDARIDIVSSRDAMRCKTVPRSLAGPDYIG